MLKTTATHVMLVNTISIRLLRLLASFIRILVQICAGPPSVSTSSQVLPYHKAPIQPCLPSTDQLKWPTPYATKFHKMSEAYLNDILNFSKNEEEPRRHLDIVIAKPRKHQLFAKRSKCRFLLKQRGKLDTLRGIHKGIS